LIELRGSVLKLQFLQEEHSTWHWAEDKWDSEYLCFSESTCFPSARAPRSPHPLCQASWTRTCNDKRCIAPKKYIAKWQMRLQLPGTANTSFLKIWLGSHANKVN